MLSKHALSATQPHFPNNILSYFMIDSHCHLQSVKKIKLEGITGILNLFDLEDYTSHNILAKKFFNKQSLDLQVKSFTGLGLHPLNCGKYDLKILDKYLDFVDVLGEIGLDYSRGFDENQQKLLEYQISKANGKPIIIHARDCDPRDILNVIQGTFVFHCFNYGKKEMEWIVNKGGYISFSGIITFKNMDKLIEAAYYTPLDRILVETDAPFLSPVPYRGKENNPSNIIHTYQFIAKIKNICVNQFISIVEENFYRFLSKNK